MNPVKPKPPNLFLLGAPKSGTSALATSLSQHPDIFCGKKEPRYFDADVFFNDPALYPIKNIHDYLSLYDNSEAVAAKYRLDASVFNMYSQSSLRRIKTLSPNAQFLLILRDPLTATKSMFHQRLKYARKNMREVSNDFPECWSKLSDRASGHGFPEGCTTPIIFQYDRLYHYENYVPAIIKEVGIDNILILRYEDYKIKPNKTLDTIFSWLNLHQSVDIDGSKTVNTSEPISNSLWNQFLEYLINSTHRFRKSIGITGKTYTPLKRLLASTRKNDSIYLDDKYDDEIQNEFNATYQYLTSAERDGLIKRL